MASFPETSFTLLEKLGRLAPGQDEAAWQRLWELYMPALRQFIVWKGGERNADDIVQQVLVKLVDVLRTGQYKAEKGRFHSYLAMMAYNEVHVLNKTALSDRDRSVYRQFRQEERPIEDVAKKFNISRNLVSKICSRIDKRIIAIGREMTRLNAEF